MAVAENNDWGARPRDHFETAFLWRKTKGKEIQTTNPILPFFAPDLFAYPSLSEPQDHA